MGDKSDKIAWVEGVLTAVCAQPCGISIPDLRTTDGAGESIGIHENFKNTF